MENQFILKDTMAELRGISASEISLLVSGEAKGVLLLGYYVKGDKPRVSYYWNASSTATDDGGSIVKPTSQTTGRFTTTFNEVVFVEDFGARINDQTYNNAPVYIRACNVAINTLNKPAAFLTNQDYYFASVARVTVNGKKSVIIEGNGATVKVMDAVFNSTSEVWFLDFVTNNPNNDSQLYLRNLNVDGQMTFVYPTSGSFTSIKKLNTIRAVKGFDKMTFENVNISNVQGRGFLIDQSYDVVIFKNCTLKDVGGKYNIVASHDLYDSFGDGIYLGQSFEHFNPRFNRPKIYVDNCVIQSPYVQDTNSSTSYLSRIGICVENWSMPASMDYRITLNVVNSYIAGYDRGIHIEGGNNQPINADLNIADSKMEWNGTNFLSAAAIRPIIRIDNSELVNTAVVRANASGATLGGTFGEYSSSTGNEFYINNSRVEMGRDNDTIRVNGTSIFKATSSVIDFKGRSARFLSAGNPKIEFLDTDILGVFATTNNEGYFMFDTAAGKISFVSCRVVGAQTASRGSTTAPNTTGLLRPIGSKFEFVFQSTTFEDVRLHLDFNVGYNRIASTMLRFSDCTWIRNARGMAARLSGGFGSALLFLANYRYVYFDGCTFRQFANSNESANKDAVDALYNLYNVPNPISFSRSIRYFGVHTSDLNTPDSVASGFQLDAGIVN